MGDKGNRWILAFDATCADCQPISHAVRRAAGDRLEVLPLADPDVERMRHQVFGEHPPLVPTLIETNGDQVRAWKGRTIAIKLVRRLGVRTSFRVINALGGLRKRMTEPIPTKRPDDRGINRAAFLRFGLGVAMASGIVLLGRKPPLAAETTTAVDKWIAANKDHLPQDYDTLLRYAPQYRRAIIRELRPAVRSRLWVEQLDRYRLSHPELTSAQVDALKQTAAVAAEPLTYTFDGADRTAVLSRLKTAEQSVTRAFSPNNDAKEVPDDINYLLTFIGPHNGTSTFAEADELGSVPGCCCNIGSDYNLYCRFWDCYAPGDGCICGVYCCDCGFLGAYSCNGFCINTGCAYCS